MSNTVAQTRLQAYINIIKYHGIFTGLRRVWDQFTQNDYYDIKHGTNFTQIMAGEDYYKGLNTKTTEAMHYQPVYTAAVKNPILDLIKTHPVVGASSACFIDLGCGRGKALHVARSTLQHVTTIGVELNELLLTDAKNNLKQFNQPDKTQFVYSNVNNVDYKNLLNNYDIVIVFNKNSFDRSTTENTLEKIKSACRNKAMFYIYSNPVFEASLKGYLCVFEMNGWHKNWNTKTFKIV